jgi:hypothetical protein
MHSQTNHTNTLFFIFIVTFSITNIISDFTYSKFISLSDLYLKIQMTFIPLVKEAMREIIIIAITMTDILSPVALIFAYLRGTNF